LSAVIEVEGLRKEFRRLRGGSTLAVNGLDLEVPHGVVFGFPDRTAPERPRRSVACWGLLRPEPAVFESSAKRFRVTWSA
jgi:ABC-2 type transport system ATP-binding protein